MNDLQAARALGWASLGIAAAEAFAHRQVSDDLLGTDDHPTLMKALAAREAAAGVTILSQTAVTPTLAAGLWSRVAGDALDLALLGLAAARTRRPAELSATTATVLAITAADVWVAWRDSRRLASQAARSSAPWYAPERRTGNRSAPLDVPPELPAAPATGGYTISSGPETQTEGTQSA
jgi:hypothetical protein